MADNRKYYYLKLKESYFDEDAIVLLESMQDGMLEPFPKKRTQKVKKKWNDSRGIRYRWLCSGAEKIILKTRGRNPTQSRVRAEGVVEDFQIGKDIALRRRSGWIVF